MCKEELRERGFLAKEGAQFVLRNGHTKDSVMLNMTYVFSRLMEEDKVTISMLQMNCMLGSVEE